MARENTPAIARVRRASSPDLHAFSRQWYSRGSLDYNICDDELHATRAAKGSITVGVMRRLDFQNLISTTRTALTPDQFKWRKVERLGDRRYFENLDNAIQRGLGRRRKLDGKRWRVTTCPVECFRKAGVEPLEKQTLN
ncbi:hypothetical protein DMN91_013024 [Ooceraea biroi]|uniref:Uncharacterized protein n=1 Tax=Ooceraea biroi TaxID=2015173 RepID=A0A3L8D3P9_OOCBI|nr:hypothetical protein DMN91_013024 [Ooceraea biroi]